MGLAGLIAASAAATVGEPDEIVVLGFDPSGRSIYYEEIRGAEGVRRTWGVDLDDEVPGPQPEEVSPELRARLVPLIERDRVGLEVTERTTAVEPCVQPPSVGSPWCEVVDVEVRLGRLRGQAHLVGWGQGELRALWSVPAHDAVLALYRYVGETFEGGYTVDVPLLLLPEAPALPLEDWYATCADGCTLQIGETSVQAGLRGEWICREDGRLAACVWTHTNGAYQLGWFVDRQRRTLHPFAMPTWGSDVVADDLWWEGGRLRLRMQPEQGSLHDVWRVPPGFHP